MQTFKPADVPKLTPTNTWKSTPSDSMSLLVLSYVDGSRTISDIASMCAKNTDEIIKIISDFANSGLIETPSEPNNFSSPFVEFTDLSSLDLSPLKEKTDLPDDRKEEIFFFYHALKNMNPFQILGLDKNASDAEVKKSYQKLTLRFHPDRFYGKNLGSMKNMPNLIFKAITESYSLLSDSERRKQQEELYFRETEEPEIENNERKTKRSSKTRNKILKKWINSLKDEEPEQNSETYEISEEELKAKKKRHRKYVVSKQMRSRNKKAVFHFKEGKSAYEKQQYSSAMSHLKMAVALDPLNIEAKKLFEEVKPLAENVLVSGYLNKARMEEELGNTETAANLYALAAEVVPSVRNLIKASKLQAKAGFYYKAKELALQAVTMHSTLETEINLAEIYITAKMYNRAKTVLETLLEKHPENKDIKVLLKQVKKLI